MMMKRFDLGGWIVRLVTVAACWSATVVSSATGPGSGAQTPQSAQALESEIVSARAARDHAFETYTRLVTTGASL